VDVPTQLAKDPLGFVPRAAPPADVELMAYLAAGLAMGNLAAIGRSVARTVAALHDPSRLGFEGHRWVRGHDIAVVIERLRTLQARFGSLEGAFLDGHVPGSVAGGLSRLSYLVLEGVPLTRGVRSLAASPVDGSACKRLNLFLRWVVRRDQVDLGLWTTVSPADLVAPLDVHVIAFARRFGLVTRKATDWRFAEALTDFFRALRPDDPLAWDFPISHFGMLTGWDDHPGFDSCAPKRRSRLP
jgi:uncharacterized protein (TIGR02757 family)